MPESVKITNLPELSSLQNDDIIVVVDGNETQTSKATLGQVKNLDCGPNTVKETAIAQGAVTKQKIGMSSANKIIYSGGVSVGGKVLGEETDLTQYARQLLAAGAGGTEQQQRDAFRALLNESATFQRIFTAFGSADQPSYSFTDAPSTGMFAGSIGLLLLASNGKAVLRLSSDGTIESLQTPPDPNAYPNAQDRYLLTLGVNAYASFTPAAAPATIFKSGGSNIAEFFGMPRTIVGVGQYGQSVQENVIRAASDAIGTMPPITGGGTAGVAIGSGGSGNLLAIARWLFDNGYDPSTFSYTTGSFTSSFDNSNAVVGYNGPAGSPLYTVANLTAGSGNAHINTISVSTIPSVLTAGWSRGVSSILAVSGVAGLYRMNFSTPFPDTNYIVMGGGTNNGGTIISDVTRNTNNCTFRVINNAGGAVTTGTCWAACLR